MGFKGKAQRAMIHVKVVEQQWGNERMKWISRGKYRGKGMPTCVGCNLVEKAKAKRKKKCMVDRLPIGLPRLFWAFSGLL